MAPVPELDMARVCRWIDARNDGLPERAVGLIRYEMDVDARSITIVECRPPWRHDYGPEWTRHPVARLRYTKSRREWSLFWRDRNQKFHLYDRIEPSPNVAKLLAEIDADPTSIFWG